MTLDGVSAVQPGALEPADELPDVLDAQEQNGHGRDHRGRVRRIAGNGSLRSIQSVTKRSAQLPRTSFLPDSPPEKPTSDGAKRRQESSENDGSHDQLHECALVGSHAEPHDYSSLTMDTIHSKNATASTHANSNGANTSTSAAPPGQTPPPTRTRSAAARSPTPRRTAPPHRPLSPSLPRRNQPPHSRPESGMPLPSPRPDP